MPAHWKAGGGLSIKKNKKTGEKTYVVTAKGETMGLGKKGEKLTYEQAIERKVPLPGDSSKAFKNAQKAVSKSRPAKTTGQSAKTIRTKAAQAQSAQSAQPAQPFVSRADVVAQNKKRKAAKMAKAKAKAKANANAT